MKAVAVTLAATLLTCASAFADTQTQNVSYSYHITDPDNARLSFLGFDDMNGQRTLTGVAVRVQADVAATLAVENMTATTLTEWHVEGEHLVIAGFNRETPEEFGPFAFLGGLNIEPFTGTLQPNDGTPGSGPDFLAHSDSVPLNSTIEFETKYLDFFTGPGEIVGFAGPFTEFLVDGLTMWDPDLQTGDATIGFTELTETGSVSLIYTFTAVPEPTSALTFAAAAMLIARRHRRR